MIFLLYLLLIFILQTHENLLPCNSPRSLIATVSLKDILIWDLAYQSDCVVKLTGHTSTVTKLVFTKDFQFLFSASADKTVKQWNVATGALVRTLTNHANGLTALNLSPDGTILVSGDSGGTIIKWSTTDFSVISTLTGASMINDISFTHDGSYLIYGTNKIEKYNMNTGVVTLISVPSLNSVTSFAITTDDKYLITGGGWDLTARMIDLTTNTAVGTFSGHGNTVFGVAINSQNTILATASADNKIKLWDISTKTKIKDLTGHTNIVMTVRFSNDDNILLSGSTDKNLKIWDVSNGINLITFNGLNTLMDIRIAENCLVTNAGPPIVYTTCDNQYTLINAVPTNNICSANLNMAICNSGVCSGYMLGLICLTACPSPYWTVQATKYCVASCPSNTYQDNTNKICLACDSSCSTCSGAGTTNCLTCTSGSAKPYHESPTAGVNGQCLSSCASPNPFADDTTGRCETVCPTTWGLLITNKCVATCPSDYYIDSVNRLCVQCDTTCDTCSGSGPTKCRTCSPLKLTKYHELPTTNTDGSCLSSCTGSYPYADDTTSRCYFTCPVPSWGLATTSKCETNCPSNYFTNSANRMCEQCDTTCDTCSAAGSTYCRTCSALKATKYHELPTTNTDGSCLSTCTVSYPYADDTTNRCYFTCPAPSWGLATTSKCETNCPSNYFTNSANRMCELCDTTCDTCSAAGATYCRTCSALKATKYHEFPTTNTDGNCLGSCTVSYPYADDNSNRCYLMCPIPLWGLSTTNKCEVGCPIEYNSNPVNRLCDQCDSTCETCSMIGPTKCLTCTSLKLTKYHELPTTNTDGSCLSTCTVSYPFADDNTNRCYLVCPIPLWGLSTTNKCEANCPSGYYIDSVNRLCVQCDATCDTCSGAGPTKCITCSSLKATKYHELPTTNTDGSCLSTCTVSYPYADDNSNRCYLVCPIPLFGLSTSKKCEISCPSTYDAVTRECQLSQGCDSTCKTCQQSNVCTSCNSPYYLSGSNCVTACPSPFWGNNNTRVCASSCSNRNEFGDESDKRICKICSLNCVTCLKRADICTSCLSGLFLYDIGTTVSCTKCEGIGFYVSGSNCYAYVGGCEKRKDANSCDKCIQGLYLRYSNKSQTFEGTCTKCVNTGEYIDNYFPSSDGTGVCLTHAECLIANCKNCSNLLKRCAFCEAGYYLFSYLGDGKDYCSVCQPDLYLRYDSSQKQMICSPKKLITGKLLAISNPVKFLLSFNENWENYFKDYLSNIAITISNLSENSYGCLIQRNDSLNNSYDISCTFKANVSVTNSFKVTLMNIPLEQESSEIVIRGSEYELTLENFTVCPENFTLNKDKGFCESLFPTFINVDIRNTISPLKYHLIFDQEIPKAIDSNIYKWINGKFKMGRILAQDINYNYSIKKINPITFELQFDFKNTIHNGPIFNLEITSNDPNIKFTKTEIPIILEDYYYLNEADKTKIAQSGQVSKAGSQTAQSLVPLNNIFSPQSTFAVKGLLLIQTFQLLRFINISYPPNVLELFDDKLSSFLNDFDIPVSFEDGILDGQFYKFNFSIYILNNSGSYMLGGWIYLISAVLGYYLIPYFKKKYKNKILQYIFKTLEATLVWNLYLTHFLSRYMILAFTAAAGFRFAPSKTDMGRFNILIALISNVFIYILPVLIFIKLIEMRKLKFRKISPEIPFHFRQTLRNYSKIFQKRIKLLNSPKGSLFRQNTNFDRNSPNTKSKVPTVKDKLIMGDIPLGATQSGNIDSKEIKVEQIDDSYSSRGSIEKQTEIQEILGLDYQQNTRFENEISSRDSQTANTDENKKVFNTLTDDQKMESEPRSRNHGSRYYFGTNVIIPPNQEESSEKYISIQTQTQPSDFDPEEALKNEQLEHFKNCYKPIHEDYLDDNFLKYNFLLFELCRQILISYIILFNDNEPVRASLSIMLINGIFIIFMIWIKPFKSLQTLVLALIVEFFLFIICLGTMGLAFLQDLFNRKGLTHDFDLYLQIGWVIVYSNIILIYFYLVMQGINYYNLIKDLYKNLFPKIKTFIDKKRKPKTEF